MEKLVRLLLCIALFTVFLVSCPNAQDNNGDGVTTTLVGSSTTTTTLGRLITHKGFTNSYQLLNRDIKVYLPLGYDPSSDATYPVVYMHDGQNLFFAGGPFGSWHVETAYDGLIAKDLIDPLIIVGINNTNDRIPEYTPTLDANYAGSGKGESYVNFIINDLIPFINSNYKTKTGPENTAIIGSSLGGLISLYASWNHPDVFGKAGCLSSSLWWDNNNLLNQVLAYTGSKKSVKYWIDCGTAEGNDGDDQDADTDNDGRTYMIEDSRTLAYKLSLIGWEDNVDLCYKEDVGAAHSEAAWSGRIDDVLYYFFRKSAPALTGVETRLFSNKIGLTGITKTYASADLHYENDFSITQVATNITIADSTVATVDNTLYGKIAPLKVGITKVSASFGGFDSEADFEVVADLPLTIRVFFNVTCADTGGAAVIYIAGDGGPVPPEKAWDSTGFASTTKISSTNYQFLFTMKRNTSFSFKFTKGTNMWEVIPSNRIFGSSEDATVDYTVASW